MVLNKTKHFILRSWIHGDLEKVGKWTVMVLYKPEAVNHRQSLSLNIHLSQKKETIAC